MCEKSTLQHDKNVTVREKTDGSPNDGTENINKYILSAFFFFRFTNTGDLFLLEIRFIHEKQQVGRVI